MKRFLPLLNRILRPYASVLSHNKKLNFRPYAVGVIGGIFVGSVTLFPTNISHWFQECLQRKCVQAATVDGGGKMPPGVNFIADVVEKVLPAVVFIECVRGPRRFNLAVGSGSGFIVHENGLILTNGHVVGNSKHVTVTLSNGQKLDGRVIAIDPTIDVALVSVSSTKLSALPLGQSSDLRTGEWVVALGSPHFLTNSVTVGVVSAKERDLGHFKGMRYIQTDAVITHGNSGGPLVNVNGEVVGINTLKLEAGIGFAVPADIVRKFVEKSLERISDENKIPTPSGSIFGRLFNYSKEPPTSKTSDSSSEYEGPVQNRQSYIGISMMTLNANILLDLNRMKPGYFNGITHGVLVHSVYYDSPADTAGLQPLDVIVSINNQEVHSAKEVYKSVNSASGGTLNMLVIRGGQRMTLTVRPEFIDGHR